MADYNVNMKQWNGGSFDNVLPLAFNSKALEGKSYDDIIQYVQSLFGTGGENCRIAWGSYVGDGRVGEDEPVTLSFDFYPAAIFVAAEWGGRVTCFIHGCPYANSTNGCDMKVTWTAHSAAWCYNGTGGTDQNNKVNATYYYIALGYED